MHGKMSRRLISQMRIWLLSSRVICMRLLRSFSALRLTLFQRCNVAARFCESNPLISASPPSIRRAQLLGCPLSWRDQRTVSLHQNHPLLPCLPVRVFGVHIPLLSPIMSPEICLRSIHSSDVFQGSLYLFKKARLISKSQSGHHRSRALILKIMVHIR